MAVFHIIGAGISGLVLAYELAKAGAQVHIYEKLSLPGGLARTEIINGKRIDCGPHLYHTNNEEIRDYWKRLPGINFLTPQLYGANYKNGKVYEYPLSEHSMKKQFSVEDYEAIIAELSAATKNQNANASNYKEFVEALAGPKLSKLFFEKYPQKLWGIPIEHLSAKFAPRRVQIRKEQMPFHAGGGKWAGVIDGGCGVMAEILEAELNKLGVYIDYRSELTNITIDEATGTSSQRVSGIELNHNRKVDINNSDTLVMTTPLTKVCELMGIDNQLWYRCLKIVAHVFNRKVSLIDNYDWLYFDSDELLMHRLTLQDSFRDNHRPRANSILSAEIAYSKGDKIHLMEDDEIIERNIQDLHHIGLIEKAEILSSNVIDAGEVYPGISVGYEAEVERVNKIIHDLSNLYMHGAPATFEYADLQVLTAKSLDLAKLLLAKENSSSFALRKHDRLLPSRKITIGSHQIGDGFPCFIIAEIGLNHNGDIKLAKQMIDAAHRAGASAVKFQTYKKGRVSKSVRSARYYEDLIDTQESLPDFLDRIIFESSQLQELFDYSKEVGIVMFSTAFDILSLKQLEELGCPAYKISSMDLANLPLIRAVAATGKPMIISTGMSNMTEMSTAVETTLTAGNPNLAVLHCVSSYPCPPQSANLPMINKIRQTFDTVTGYSDHTTGIDIAMASVALGASVIEKHFTLDRRMDGPDQNFSIVENELSQLVTSSRRINSAMIYQGYGIMPQELSTAQNLKRSIFYSRDIQAGALINEKDLEIKSPGVGIHPKFIDMLVGRKLERPVKNDMPAEWEDFE